jgi:hypothetical protein
MEGVARELHLQLRDCLAQRRDDYQARAMRCGPAGVGGRAVGGVQQPLQQQQQQQQQQQLL